MGYNTTIVIYNDNLQEIKKNKSFGKKLYNAIMTNYSKKHPISILMKHGTAGQVIEQHHADQNVLIEVGGNTGIIKENK